MRRNDKSVVLLKKGSKRMPHRFNGPIKHIPIDEYLKEKQN